MTPEKEQAFTEKGRINSLASCGAYVAANRLFDASLDACRHYYLEGTVHTTGLAGGFDYSSSGFDSRVFFAYRQKAGVQYAFWNGEKA